MHLLAVDFYQCINPLYQICYCSRHWVYFKRKTIGKYKDHAQNERVNSIDNAVNDERASYEELNGINIMTDARHGWRKNSKDTSVVALGEQTHKVMDCIHITKSQDKVAQRHERLGTQNIYENMESINVSKKIHSHDRNMSQQICEGNTVHNKSK